MKCEKCGCVFVAAPDDAYWVDQSVKCPQDGCAASVAWDSGEPYEEPTPTLTDRERMVEVIAKFFNIGDSYCYNLTREKSAFAIGTMSPDDFIEFDDEMVDDMTDYLLKHGVTFREG